MIRYFGLALWFCFFIPDAGAFRLDPMVLAVAVDKPQAIATFTVENNTPAKIALQFEVTRRIMDANGIEQRPAAQGFTVYPEQMALAPGEKRSVRVNWVGESMPTSEQAYRFIASQLPVDFQAENKKAAANLKFLVEYVASFYLVPPKASAKMKILRHTVNKGKVEILVANEGTAHQLLELMEITLTSGAKKVMLGAELLAEVRTENVLAGSQRILRVPLPSGMSAKGLSVTINFNP